jgi:hypothetical protein
MIFTELFKNYKKRILRKEKEENDFWKNRVSIIFDIHTHIFFQNFSKKILIFEIQI